LHAISHITGGGILENTSRVVSEKLKIKIDWESWDTPYIFDLIQKKGDVPIEDMRKSFNLGIGMILVIDKLKVDTFTEHLKVKNEKFSILGEIV
jgi:phosphoribosylformylglycinamidine cyclo-ligase